MILLAPDIEKRLLLLISEGDEASFEQLYNCYRGWVYVIAKMLIKTEQEAEDILQEVFTRIWAIRDQLPEVEDFKAWLGTITRNSVYNLLKKKATEEISIRNTAAPAELEINTPFNITQFRDLQYVLHEAINELPSQQQKVFKMGRIDGLKHTEIAQHLGISKETVKKHMMEAIKNVKKFLSVKGAAFMLLLNSILQNLIL